MLSETMQISLRWHTPNGRLNSREFRKKLSFQLGASNPEQSDEWGWLFHSQKSQKIPSSIATIRFSTGIGRSDQAFAQITAVGQESCEQLSKALIAILAAVRAIGITGHPAVDTNQVWIKKSPFPKSYRLQAVVLRKVKGNQAYYDSLRANPELLIPYVQEVVATGINRQAEALGLEAPDLTPEHIQVLQVDELGTQPAGKKGALETRLSQALVTIPLDLNGDWRVGGLLSYGSGLLTSIASEAHYREPTRERKPFPKYSRTGTSS